MAFLSTPGMDRLYSGVTNSKPCDAEISAFKRLTLSAWLASSSWLYRGRSPISSFLKVNSGGPSLINALASCRLKDSCLKLPITTAIWYWLMFSLLSVRTDTDQRGRKVRRAGDHTC